MKKYILLSLTDLKVYPQEALEHLKGHVWKVIVL